MTISHDFPALSQYINDEPLVYLDNAATTQKPQSVLDGMLDYYRCTNANVHRGVHTLSERATQAYEVSRETVKHFIHATSSKEIIFTRGATTGLNRIADFAASLLKPGDEVLISVMEHHANLIPWQQACQKTGARLRFIGLKDGLLDMVELEKNLSDRTKFVSLTQLSNVLGTLVPIKEIAQMVHAYEAYLVVDAAQSIAHLPIDVQDLACDFLVFSGHKVYGPTGIGVLYGRQALLDMMSPMEFGGSMIESVSQNHATWAGLPYKLEAGTPPIAEAIGLGQALNYVTEIGFEKINELEEGLLTELVAGLSDLSGVTLYTPKDSRQHMGVVSFNLEGIHPHDVATALDAQGIAVRAGHHCAQPLMTYLGITSSVRVSLGLYNTSSDVQTFLKALQETREFFYGTF